MNLFNQILRTPVLRSLQWKVRDQITFLTPPTYIKVFEILVPIDGSYFSHSRPGIWRSKLGIYEEIIKNVLNK